ncbi:MAG: thermonuclease family protein [Phycisphaerae bacterium]
MIRRISLRAILFAFAVLASVADHAELFGRRSDDFATYHHRTTEIVAVADETTIEIDLADAESPTTLIALEGLLSPTERDVAVDMLDPSDMAIAFLETHAIGRRVRLLVDEQRATRDADGRLAAYVWFDDDRREMLNEQMVREGWATASETPHLFRLRFEQHDRRARRNELGVWAGGANE